MEARNCPRCGSEIASTAGRRGRPRRWCSPECRRLASEERRAARSSGAVVEVREEVRERVVERSRPISSIGAVDRVLATQPAVEKLLRVLAYRMRHDPPVTDVQRWLQSRLKPLIYDLWMAYGESQGHPAPPPPEHTAPVRDRGAEHRQAVAAVLDSPRSSREVLHELARRARKGELASGEHTATVAAAQELIEALVVSRTLRRRR